MKRTVTRYVSDEEMADLKSGGRVLIIPPTADQRNYIPVALTYDDGEPEWKCPCDNPEIPCCQKKGDPNRGNRYDCCACHDAMGKAPCLSDWHKKAESATRDRVVEGWVRPAAFKDDAHTKWHSSPVYRDKYDSRCSPATLIIHEPVKEPTLVEAVEAFLHGWNNGPTYEAGKRMGDLRAALAREKEKSR